METVAAIGDFGKIFYFMHSSSWNAQITPSTIFDGHAQLIAGCEKKLRRGIGNFKSCSVAFPLRKFAQHHQETGNYEIHFESPDELEITSAVQTMEINNSSNDNGIQLW